MQREGRRKNDGDTIIDNNTIIKYLHTILYRLLVVYLNGGMVYW